MEKSPKDSEDKCVKCTERRGAWQVKEGKKDQKKAKAGPSVAF
ncbi:hypothetical protein COLO4_19039 [Corchorus olitorius]|uniref:Uncharacterized protein n=1 Tax=Corchorus olitorius TaxID=93759 RepID=A0A1R3J747_9ROSI|nr:hypothetical protein COLO4_19039 [Corchorus olitorius]